MKTMRVRINDIQLLDIPIRFSVESGTEHVSADLYELYRRSKMAISLFNQNKIFQVDYGSGF